MITLSSPSLLFFFASLVTIVPEKVAVYYTPGPIDTGYLHSMLQRKSFIRSRMRERRLTTNICGLRRRPSMCLLERLRDVHPHSLLLWLSDHNARWYLYMQGSTASSAKSPTCGVDDQQIHWEPIRCPVKSSSMRIEWSTMVKRQTQGQPRARTCSVYDAEALDIDMAHPRGNK